MEAISHLPDKLSAEVGTVISRLVFWSRSLLVT